MAAGPGLLDVEPATVVGFSVSQARAALVAYLIGAPPGDSGSTMPLVDNPDEVIICDPGCCAGCGADVSGAPVLGVARRQVVELPAPPPPRVTEYQVITRDCRSAELS